MKILAIETSCDDTCVAVLEDDRILSNVISSQTNLHSTWGGVVPDIAKRAHESRIKAVIATALIRAKFSIFNFSATGGFRMAQQFSKNKEEKIEQIIQRGINCVDVIAVTQGPGLAVALGVGIAAAKELAVKYNKKLVAVNHVEGHILSNWLKNSVGGPNREIEFPALALTASGGHTKLVLVNQNEQFSISPPRNFQYQVVGDTLDDAAGEALDKAAKMLGMGYPGGPIIERLAIGGDESYLELPRPMRNSKDLNYSFSGLKTSFYYQIRDWPKDKVGTNLHNLAATYQRAVFDSLIIKFNKAIEKYQPKSLLACGGVMANLTLRKRLRQVARSYQRPIYFPFKKELNTDNAAMIGIVGYYKALKGEFVKNSASLDREARMEL